LLEGQRLRLGRVRWQDERPETAVTSSRSDFNAKNAKNAKRSSLELAAAAR
jgi:hypothetical protein